MLIGCSQTVFFFIFLFCFLWTSWWMVICPPGCVICLWVILTRGIDIWCISQSLSRWWMEQSAWWMKNDTLVSHCLMNIKCQVCDVCVCACACRDKAERWHRKLGKAFCFNLSLAFQRSHPRQHSHTHCIESRIHMHLHIYCLLCFEPMQLFLALLLNPCPYLLPQWPRPKLPQALIWIKPS